MRNLQYRHDSLFIHSYTLKLQPTRLQPTLYRGSAQLIFICKQYSQKGLFLLDLKF
jgi:hypothetical protein